MKKQSNKKRLTLAVSIMLVAAMAAGVTYAWFTASYSGAASNAELGSLAVAGTFVADTEDVKYQPGDTVDIEGTVENTGSLALMARVTMSTTTTLVRDKNGTPLPGGETILVNNDPNVKAAVDESSLASEIMEDGTIIAWYRHKTNPGEYYVVLEPGLESELNLEAVFAGSGMGNQYMDATVSFSTGWDATQTREGAILEKWGIVRGGANPNVELIPVRTRGFVANDDDARILARLDELFS